MDVDESQCGAVVFDPFVFPSKLLICVVCCLWLICTVNCALLFVLSWVFVLILSFCWICVDRPASWLSSGCPQWSQEKWDSGALFHPSGALQQPGWCPHHWCSLLGKQEFCLRLFRCGKSEIQIVQGWDIQCNNKSLSRVKITSLQLIQKFKYSFY